MPNAERRIGNQEIVFTPPLISLKDLFGGDLPSQKLIIGEIIYQRFGKMPVYLSAVALPDGAYEFYFFGQPLDGEQVNALLYFAAPSKAVYGFDTNDVLDDEESLFSDQTPEGIKRREAHQRIPNWQLYERERTRFYASMRKYRDRLPFESADLITPVAVWQRTKGGQRKWIFEPQDTSSLEHARKHATTQSDMEDGFFSSQAFGAVMVAGFSPEITTTWPERLNYQLREGGGTNNMGATQAFPLVLAFADQLLASDLIQRAETYCLTGKVREMTEDTQPLTPLLELELASQTALQALPSIVDKIEAALNKKLLHQLSEKITELSKKGLFSIEDYKYYMSLIVEAYKKLGK